jgi:hypothetical protein
MKLKIVPSSIREANEFVRLHHRHHGTVQGAKFALAVADEGGAVVGIALVGRPIARLLDDGITLEVTRVATDGSSNACSALYSAARRVARELGYKKIITYTLASEPGTSLKAVGWTMTAQSEGGSWSRVGRPRTDKHPTEPKQRWEAIL